MKDSLERLYRDRNEAEQAVFDIAEELRNYEEDSDEWCDIFHELTEAENSVDYIQSWIDSIESGYEE
jgi:hypothetical protein